MDDTNQTNQTALLALLERIAAAMEKQNQLTEETASAICGVAHRIEDAARYMA